MCAKLPLEDLNPDPCLSHSTSTYTCVLLYIQPITTSHMFFFFINFGYFIRKVKRKYMASCNWWNIKWNTKNGIENLYSSYGRWDASTP